jgi:hypothetical protein
VHVVLVLEQALVAVALAAVVLSLLHVIGSVIITVWSPAMLVLGGAGTLGGLSLIVWAIRQENVWLGVGGALCALFFAWIFAQERQLASARSLREPGQNQ